MNVDILQIFLGLVHHKQLGTYPQKNDRVNFPGGKLGEKRIVFFFLLHDTGLLGKPTYGCVKNLIRNRSGGLQHC
jgi:hypothetical protein